MSSCTFFGHRDCPRTIEPQLRAALIDLIEHHGVDVFYVGHQGVFDALVRSTLLTLAQTYPHITCSIVLAYLPTAAVAALGDTLLPDGIETVPRRFAISWRNQWMLRQADYVVTYAVHPGNAAQYAALASRQRKTVVALHSV